MTERQAQTIFAAEYAAAVPDDVGRDPNRDMEARRRAVAVKRLATVCHDRRVIAKVSGTPLSVVRKWLGDESRVWPTTNQKE